MTITYERPADVMTRQIAIIESTVAALRIALADAMDSTNPDAVTWQDVAKLAQVCDKCRSMVGA